MIVRWPSEAIWEAVAPVLPGFTVEVLPSIESTNTELMRRARLGQVDPVLVVAERQTAGRGRLGRQWHSAEEPQGDDRLNSLTFSLGMLLQPQNWSGLSLAVGISLAHSLHPSVQLKWPNDLWWKEQKLGGILIETASVGAQRYAVIGVGLNIHLPSSSLETQTWRTPPTSLQAFMPGVEAPDVLQQVVPSLVRYLQRFEATGFEPLREAYQQRDLLIGREVVCSDGLVGIAGGVESDGALLVHTARGPQNISSAEVSVRPAPMTPLPPAD